MNSIVLIGRLTKDPELRYIPSSGKAVANFNIAVDRPFTPKDGQKQADFFTIIVWGKMAENCANFLAKGRLVGIKGRVENRSYDAQDGTKRYVTEIIADQVQFLERAGAAAGSDSFKEDGQNAAADVFQAPEGFSPKSLNEEGYKALEDDDVPF